MSASAGVADAVARAAVRAGLHGSDPARTSPSALAPANSSPPRCARAPSRPRCSRPQLGCGRPRTPRLAHRRRTARCALPDGGDGPRTHPALGERTEAYRVPGHVDAGPGLGPHADARLGFDMPRSIARGPRRSSRGASSTPPTRRAQEDRAPTFGRPASSCPAQPRRARDRRPRRSQRTEATSPVSASA